MPRVSVIIPTYNRARLVQEAIRSAQAQTHSDVEIIVVDDASTDNTADVVQAMAAADPRITLVRQPENRDAQAARNAGLGRATGEFANFLDSDDQFAPDKLEKQLTVFEQQPGLDMVVCQALMFHHTPGDTDFVWNDLDPALTAPDSILDRLLHNAIGWGVLQPLYRRAFLDRLGPLPEDLTVMDDRELQIRAACRAAAIAMLPDALAYIRIHHQDGDNQASKGTRWTQPPELRARLAAWQMMWREIQRAGFDSERNRRVVASELIVLARLMANRRMTRAAGTAWWLALRTTPDAGTRARLLAVSPLLPFVAITGRSGHRLPALWLRLGLEQRPDDKYLKSRYTGSTPDKSHD